jgi:hypothetical protein
MSEPREAGLKQLRDCDATMCLLVNGWLHLRTAVIERLMWTIAATHECMLNVDGSTSPAAAATETSLAPLQHTTGVRMHAETRHAALRGTVTTLDVGKRSARALRPFQKRDETLAETVLRLADAACSGQRQRTCLACAHPDSECSTCLLPCKCLALCNDCAQPSVCPRCGRGVESVVRTLLV